MAAVLSFGSISQIRCPTDTFSSLSCLLVSRRAKLLAKSDSSSVNSLYPIECFSHLLSCNSINVSPESELVPSCKPQKLTVSAMHMAFSDACREPNTNNVPNLYEYSPSIPFAPSARFEGAGTFSSCKVGFGLARCSPGQNRARLPHKAFCWHKHLLYVAVELLPTRPKKGRPGIQCSPPPWTHPIHTCSDNM